MRLKYFPDTDTAYLELTNNEVVETRDINEDILIDIDIEGNLVGMTIEHAQIKANLSEFSYQQVIDKKSLTKKSS
jgi:uncharacterized protein YuzE